MSSLRIAVVGTPRSGNTWVRYVLGDALDLQQMMPVHNPRDIAPELPERAALQIHWYREPNFQAFLRTNGFRVVVVARHPLDVLISALHFRRREWSLVRWLEGNAEFPPDFAEYAPASPSFVAYATSWGAENLLSVSYQWWHDRDAIRVRYEQLVREPVAAFTSLVEQLNEPADRVAKAIEANPFKAMQDLPNKHGWRGTPGLWRQLIPPLDAWRIFRRHRRVFDTLGYGIPPYLLTRRAALRNWQRLAI
ncbi:MAG: sulfotransferase domain-containing protein [Acidobacteriia bacterium]|nr:sulfotransferase domain-containing protein [Terriglobia bacterium]